MHQVGMSRMWRESDVRENRWSIVFYKYRNQNIRVCWTKIRLILALWWILCDVGGFKTLHLLINRICTFVFYISIYVIDSSDHFFIKWNGAVHRNIFTFNRVDKFTIVMRKCWFSNTKRYIIIKCSTQYTAVQRKLAKT